MELEKGMVRMTKSGARVSLLLLGLVVGCSSRPSATGWPTPASPPTREVIAATQLSETASADGVMWDLYHPDPQHLWNRLFRQLFERADLEGQSYESDSLDPLLWYETTYLLEVESHLQAIRLLDDFLATAGAHLVSDPLPRALLQRDLWAVFDWLTLRSDTYPAERLELQSRLARIIRDLGLPRGDILSLPDNYRATVDSGSYPTVFQTDRPATAFLPADLTDPRSGWLLLGREGGPLAMAHTEAFPFFGRSVFLVFLRAPGGRGATLDLLQRLNTEQWPNPLAGLNLTGVEVALVRKALLVDGQGEMVLSPIVESVQLRHFSPLQFFYQFNLDRAGLLRGESGGLHRVQKEFVQFFSHGCDPFELDCPQEASIPEFCRVCHAGEVYGVQSILSYSRFRFDLPEGTQPILLETSLESEARSVISWKLQHPTWEAITALWSDRLLNEARPR